MTKDEALKLALEALVEMSPSGPIGSEIWHKQMNAIRVAGDALAQPEQEPWCMKMNGCKTKCEDCPDEAAQPEQERVAPTCERCADEIVENNAGLCANCLPAICTEQEPVFKWCSVFQEMPTKDSHLLFCFGVHVVEGSYTKKGWASLAYGEAHPDFWAYMPPPPHHKRNQELYAIPPKRPWVGLTDEKRSQLVTLHHGWNEYGQAIEAKLKEKNAP